MNIGPSGAFPERLAARRAAVQLLHRPADVRHAADVAREVAGIQAQDAHAARRPPAAGVVRLLPAWDTYLMGYRDRSFLVTPGEWARIMPGGGLLRPAVLLDGVAIALWRARRAGKRIVVELDPFARLNRSTQDAIEAEVADLGRFEGTPAKVAAP